MFMVVVLIASGASGNRFNDEAPQVHVFYYLWYAAKDGKYIHWDHSVLPHWDTRVREKYRDMENKRYNPPEELHSVYYPLLGPYSSADEKTVDQHFAWMKQYEIDAAVLSWTGRQVLSDTQGVKTDDVFPFAIAAAQRYNIKIAVHLEPYHGRSPKSIKEDIRYLKERYGDSLIYKNGLPLIYIYDAYHSSSEEWHQLLCHDGNATIRNDPTTDVYALATILERNELFHLAECFDGIYTYFATDGFTFGATSENWAYLKQFAHQKNKILSISLGPGYNDTKIRPWNSIATRDRRQGAYFQAQLNKAIAADPDIISITSFNEWGEGTQIEPAQPYPHHLPGYDFLLKEEKDHQEAVSNNDPFLYLELLRKAKRSWKEQRRRLFLRTNLRDEV